MVSALAAAHAVAATPFCFSIAGSWSSISIRDQMIRAETIARNLVAERLIDKGNRPFLIVGAGAAGATAAVAAQHDAGVYVIDSGLGPFGPQSRSTRWIDPTQYDWPLHHWDVQTYPHDPRGHVRRLPPLAWTASPANLLAVRWDQVLRLSGATMAFSTRCLIPTPATWRSQDRVPVEFLSSRGYSPALPTEYGAVLFCTGHGEEDCQVNTFHGYPFWATDQLETARCGVNNNTHLRLLISGGGDGALQDLLRAVTGERSAANIWRDLSAAGFDLEASQRAELISMEEHARRSLSLAVDRKERHLILDDLMSACVQLVGEYVSQNSPRIMDYLEQATKRVRNYDVKLVFDCSHFGQVYMLNRFLSLLIAEYLYRVGRPLLDTHSRVDSIAPVGHACTTAPQCHGLDHDVRTIPSTCYAPPGGAAVDIGRWNVIVLRHGLLPVAKSAAPEVIGPRHQLLPFLALP